MTGPEAQFLFARVLVLVLLYVFLGGVGLLVWQDARRTGAPERRRVPDAPRLVLLDGAGTGWPAGTTFTLGQVAVVGRDLDVDVVLGDPTLSGRHACLNQRDGAWWVEDLGSTNGSFLQGARLPGAVPAIVRSGDVLQFGAVRLRAILPGT